MMMHGACHGEIDHRLGNNVTARIRGYGSESVRPGVNAAACVPLRGDVSYWYEMLKKHSSLKALNLRKKKVSSLCTADVYAEDEHGRRNAQVAQHESR